MPHKQSGGGSSFLLTIRKVFASAFIIVTFGAYAIHDRMSNTNNQADLNSLALPTDDAANLVLSPTAVAYVPTPTATDTAVSPTLTSTVLPPTETSIPATVTAIPITLNKPVASPTNLPSATPLPPSPTPTIPTSTPMPPTPIPPTPTRSGLYRNGQYIGIVADAFYGTVQVKVIVAGSKISDVQFLDYPHDRRTSQLINMQATPYLRQEAIRAQSAQVNIVSGATLTSQAFIQSLQSALSQARA